MNALKRNYLTDNTRSKGFSVESFEVNFTLVKILCLKKQTKNIKNRNDKTALRITYIHQSRHECLNFKLISQASD